MVRKPPSIQHVKHHGLRKNAVNALLEAGCTVPEVAAITGQTFQVIEHYAAKVNRRKLGKAAILKFEAYRKNPLDMRTTRAHMVRMETKQTIGNGQFRPFSKEVAMFHSSIVSALAEATPMACQSLISQGIKFVVAVENAKGEWFLLHATDQGHAGDLARNWVEVMGARGASCRRIFPNGISAKPFLTVFEQPADECWEDAA